MSERVVFNGVHGRTGRYLRDPMTVAELAARAAFLDSKTVRSTPVEALSADGKNVDDLAEVGWAVVWAPGTRETVGVGPKFRELLDKRRSEAGTLYREIDYEADETMREFCARHDVAVGGLLKPKRLPYHLLLVGPAKDISFRFQFELDLDYAVGRLAFDDPDGYERYARAVLAAEAAPPARARELAYFGPDHDEATKLSSKLLVEPLARGDDDELPVAASAGFAQREELREHATRAALLGLIKADGPRPAVLFTASHGVGFDIDDPEQRTLQGALLAQDWPGVGRMQRTHYLAGEDVAGEDIDVHGLVAFFFACFGAGTPKNDAFPMSLGNGPTPIAPEAFISSLSQALLSHINGGALGVFGHVERAWGFSFEPLGMSGSHIDWFRAALRSIMRGERLGLATRALSNRAQVLATLLSGMLGPDERTASDEDIVLAFLEKNDALAYILLGDPAARLRVPA